LQLPVCCLRSGQDCSSEDQCCGLGCAANHCCAANGVPCVDASDCCFGTCTDHTCSCVVAGQPCTTQQECCENLACADVGASTACTTCVAASCHSVCNTGPPLSLSLPDCQAIVGAEACIQAVCQIDAFCCCAGWDTQCTDEVAENAAVPGACAGLCPEL
jgi:hypothetical protein